MPTNATGVASDGDEGGDFEREIAMFERNFEEMRIIERHKRERESEMLNRADGYRNYAPMDSARAAGTKTGTDQR
jgi:hypothetical protein